MDDDQPKEDRIAPRVLRLADAANTWDYALAVIIEEGFKVFYYPHAYDEGGHWWAIRDGRDFIASDPLALLGLIAMWERFGDQWQHHKVPDHHDAIFDFTFPDDNYESLDDAAFDQLVSDLRIFFEAIGEPMPQPLTRQRLAEFMLTFSEAREERANRD